MEPEGETSSEGEGRGKGSERERRGEGRGKKREEKPERRHGGRLSTCVRSFSLETRRVVFISCYNDRRISHGTLWHFTRFAFRNIPGPLARQFNNINNDASTSCEFPIGQERILIAPQRNEVTAREIM